MRKLFFLIVVAASCKKPSEVIGSCDRRSNDTSESFCSDAFENAPCDGKRSTSPCDRTGALAGCKTTAGTKWSFPSKTVRTIENVAFLCDGALVGVDGVALEGVTKTRLPTVASAEAAELVPRSKTIIEPMLAMVETIAAKLPAPRKEIIAPEAYEKRPVMYAQVEDLASLGVTANVAHRAEGTTILPACARLVRKMDVTDVKDVHATLRLCSEAKVLVIIRNAAIVEPTNGAGSASGDVLVFDLVSGAIIGAAPFSAASTKNIAPSDSARDFESQLKTAQEFALFNATGQKLVGHSF